MISNDFDVFYMQDDLPELETEWSNLIRNFIAVLQASKPYQVPIRIIRYVLNNLMLVSVKNSAFHQLQTFHSVYSREDSKERMWFVNCLVEDRGEGSVSYYEFLQQLKNMVK